jgi:hypothetical protein
MFLSSRSKVSLLFSVSILLSIVGTFMMTSALQQHFAHANGDPPGNVFKFDLVPSPGIKACLPNARGEVAIIPGRENQLMTVRVEGLAPKAGFALFVIEIPNKPFGISWYQSDLETDGQGQGTVNVRGIFDVETFSLSLGGPTTTFAPTHQYHLGLWFGDPEVPFNLGCDSGATNPIVTPFDGDHVAGPQALNTSNFPDNAGPLSQVQP